MMRQIAIAAVTLLVVLVVVWAAIKLLVGLVKLVVIGAAFGAGAALVFVLISRMRQGRRGRRRRVDW